MRYVIVVYSIPLLYFCVYHLLLSIINDLFLLREIQFALTIVWSQVDFIIGREIEVGGLYKGTVTSIKEYGAFVEFNGGQQGLLHISELSHEPVCSY